MIGKRPEDFVRLFFCDRRAGERIIYVNGKYLIDR